MQAHDIKMRVTSVGAAVNMALAVLKIVAGVALASPALVADGAHSLSDLASDVMVLWTLRHAQRGPDANHPYGHGRFETLATLALAAFLIITAVLIAWDGVQRVLSGPTQPPGIWALAVVAGAILAKEILFRHTLRIGKQTGSALLQANAWHHRSDALSSVVALLGIGAALMGFGWGDPVAALVIAAMLARIAWRFGIDAAAELVDTQPPDEFRQTLQECLAEIPGVQGQRDLRMRHHGARALADVSIMVDPQITVTEAHRIAEAARSHALDRIDALEDLVIHVEPAGNFDGFGAQSAPLRVEIEDQILTLINAHPQVDRIERLQLGYFDKGMQIEALVALHHGVDPVLVETQVTRSVAQALPDLWQLRLHQVSSSLHD